MSIVEVHKARELKAALKSNSDIIVIAESSLAQKVKTFKGAKKSLIVSLAAVGIVGAGAIAVSALTPAGKSASVIGKAVGLGGKTVLNYARPVVAATAVAGGASDAVIITAIIAFAGFGTLMVVMYNDYDIEIEGSGSASPVTGPGGAGKVVLKRRAK